MAKREPRPKRAVATPAEPPAEAPKVVAAKKTKKAKKTVIPKEKTPVVTQPAKKAELKKTARRTEQKEATVQLLMDIFTKSHAEQMKLMNSILAAIKDSKRK